jgi:hypothetical protein
MIASQFVDKFARTNIILNKRQQIPHERQLKLHQRQKIRTAVFKGWKCHITGMGLYTKNPLSKSDQTGLCCAALWAAMVYIQTGSRNVYRQPETGHYGHKKPRWLVGVKFVLRDAGRPFMRFAFFSAHLSRIRLQIHLSA